MPRAGLSRERVVEEAASVADQVGFDRLTMAAVAERFGVALPSLYKHVGGIDALRRDLAVHGMAVLADTLRDAAVGRVRGDALTAVATAYRQFATDRPGLYAATVRAPAPDDEEHSSVAQTALDVVVAVMRSYGIDGVDAVHALRMLRGALHGFVALDAAGGFGMPESVDDSFDRMVAAFDVILSEQAS
ncbi:MAG: TetR/AcrR family transcriptional regulator [Acidimicrobiia bacterium]|jgi:AcrR family transcriptional regulator|nr:MAG: TetR/AcrR family transcriptional regulator [Acidimicrobiia bacterium]